MVLNDEIRELIAAREPIRRVKEAARRAGTRFLREAALEVVRSGRQHACRRSTVSRWLGNPSTRSALARGAAARVSAAWCDAGWFRARAELSPARSRSRPARAAAKIHPNPGAQPLTLSTAALREPRGRVGRVEIVLSDHFVRYLLIPWSEGLVGDSERLGFARLAFRDLYGHLADAWDLCLDEQPAGQASFACAVDRALASSLREVVARAGGQLAALIPSLADCINRHRSALKAPEFCLAAAEPGRVSLAFRSRGGWQAVRSRRIDGPLPRRLPTLLKQEAAVGDATEGGVLYLCADDPPGMAPFAVPGWRVVRLAEGGSRQRPAADRATGRSGG